MGTKQKVGYYILLVALSGLFIFSGISKLSGNPMVIAGFVLAGLPIWFMYCVGIAEIVGAIGLWIRPLRVYAAEGLFIILLGAIGTTAAYESIGLALFPFVAAVVLFVVVWLGKKWF